jgi:hypothetical protein
MGLSLTPLGTKIPASAVHNPGALEPWSPGALENNRCGFYGNLSLLVMG